MITEFVLAVCISTAVAVFATLLVLILSIGALGRGSSKLNRTVAGAAYLLVLVGAIAGLWLAVILDSLVVGIAVAIVGSALLTVDAMIVAGLTSFWQGRTLPDSMRRSVEDR